MAGSISITSREHIYSWYMTEKIRVGEKIDITATGDSGDGTVPDLSIKDLQGFIGQIITIPSNTPTANYDIMLYDPDATSVDVLGGALANRHTSNQELVSFVANPSNPPPVVNGTYALSIENNSQVSAGFRIILRVYNI